MNSQDILLALQNGKISIDEAERILAGKMKGATSVNEEENLEDKEKLELDFSEELNPKRLGSPVFQERYNCKWSYYAGSMYRGISSEELVITMGKANLLSFFGSAGFGPEELEEHIKNIQSALGEGKPYGMCLISNLDNSKKEIEQVELFVRYNIPVIEAAAYSAVTAPLVYCRIKGIYRKGERIILPRRIIGKCSNLKIAQLFLSPPPEEIVKDLLKAGLIDNEEAELSKFIPLADDLAIEADSGGHTTQGVSFSLIPAVVSLKDIMKRKYKYQEEILVGCGGGIGTPDAAASAFTLGADFIFTGSINQCTAESGAHSVVKDILNTVSIHDTAITAAGDMFEIGAKVQVVKKGTQYAVRANKLYQLFRQYNSFEEIPEQIRLDIEKNYFKKTFSQVLDLVYEYKSKKNPEQLKEAEENPRFKMALIFKWYFSHCSRSTLNGDLTEKDNFVIYCGPAQGAFNQWVKGTRYEHWKNRHVDEIAGLLMHNACKKLWDKNSLVMHDGFQIERHSIKDNTDTAIAVIGMAGQFPKSSNLEQFWENIKNSVNCISEVPETRWHMDKYYDPDPKAQGKTYSKWMGVLEDADKFDPLFFNISPAEAELMDPQQRLFLENCWSCIEDAGITPSSLSGTRCGVFVGCASGEYQELADEYGLNAQGLMGRAMSILSARISYLLNLKGPSMAIETACSSSLVAIAEACTNLALGNNDLALAGGVCVLAGPKLHIMCSKSGMLSKDGQCYTFDNRANGFVPGEGVGVVLLKRLKDAVRDGDHIYGVIRGWGLNQDGKTNGITAPSVISQIQLEKDVYTRFGINPENITLIEAHGTGTKLGDPIEVEALTESFRSFTQKKNYCALGSVKSNIGHLMTGAGVAGFIKVMLALKNRMLPPSINFESVNEHISLEDSPFYVNNKLKPWEVPDGIPRRACISSFGFSGTNAHIVVEEYTSAETTLDVPVQVSRDKTLLFVLSAKSKEQLKKYAAVIKDFVELKESLNLENLAYTLQIGRENMDYRLAFPFDSRDDLINGLDAFVKGVLTENIHTANVIRNKDGKAEIGEVGEDFTEVCVLKNDFSILAQMWVKGADIGWEKLYGKIKPRRISLPTYPFSKERYWIPEKEIYSGYRKAAESGKVLIHPLLHENTSSLLEQRYTSVFTGEEIFLKHHVVNGQKVLPGAACLEMARAAVELAASDLKEGLDGLRLKNIIWAKPITVKAEPLKLNIALYPVNESNIDYVIYGDSQKIGETTYFQGSAAFIKVSEPETVDIEAVRLQCSQNILSKEYCYEAFRSAGLEYGEGHRGIEKIYVGKDQVLAKLSLESSSLDDLDGYILHPGMLDSALQASVGLMPQLESTFLPFALDELEIRGRCTPDMWAFVRYSKGSSTTDKVKKLDIDLLNQNGTICALIRGFTSRILEKEEKLNKTVENTGTLLFKQVWKKEPADKNLQPMEYVRHLVVFCDVDQTIYEDVKKDMDGAELLNLSPIGNAASEMFRGYTEQLFEEISKILGEKIFGKVLVQIVIPLGEEEQLFTGLCGLLKTAELENPNLIGQLVEINLREQRENIIEILNENSRNLYNRQVRYLNGERMVTEWEEINASPEDKSIPWKDGGRYLITGGTGGLGLIFAEEIAHKVKNSTLILTGRSVLSEDKESRLKALETSGARIEYRTVDVTDREAVKGLIREINEKFGGLDGIIHSAGVLRDGFILKKSREQFQEVLAPKVDGLVNLDEESKDLTLDFFVVFSSLAGVFGNIGQADYATANAFMDAYAEYRNKLVIAGRRKGKTLSINWPLWQEGGMKVNEETLNNMRQSSGMIAMDTEIGINAFYRCMANGEVQIMVSNGELKKLRQQLSSSRPITPIVEANPAADDIPVEKVVSYLKKLLSTVIKLPADRMEANAPFEKYGIDSIMVMELTNELEKTFGSLPKTLFFEYQSIGELAGYFQKAHKNRLVELLGADNNEGAYKRSENSKSHEIDETQTDIPSTGHKRRRFVISQDEHRDEKTSKALDVAIIGISGRYPGAENLMEFWKNLRDGKDSITEIPKERWNHSLYFDEDKNRKGKTYSKWGGFINGFDRFDPLFFNISPREAEMMDPQERLFLECVYETIEDAGYTRETLGAYNGSGMKGNVGVFAGVMYQEYQLYGVQETMQGRAVAFPGNPSSIANRVSYFFNFHGPSMAVDTMCSSSLTAIQLACQSIITGGCELAIAGGVNLSIHPNKYLLLGQGKFASSKGHCESFGQGADGYVPGEGVGAVLLKPLSKAVEDGDHIYGVIKGIALNHGGKTNGYTVPNPNAQSNVIERAFKEAGIHPRSISYIEAHGTGTSLGDPIEIAGLNKAFSGFTEDKKFCAIGSAKSNIGHCESAAGIAGLTKVLLQMKYGELVPSLHSRVLNPNIDFENTPFTVQQELSEWKRPLLKIDGEIKEYPRIAGISSFGAGGSNAHIIIEEYIPKDSSKIQIKYDTQNPAVVVLSAKSEGQLKKLAGMLLDRIESGQLSDTDFPSLAYTLQTGREAMEERLAFTASTISEFEEKLKDFKEDRSGREGLYRGRVKEHKGIIETLTADIDIEKAIDSWISKRMYEKLLTLWVNGLNIDWNKIYKNQRPIRISLPTYPFERERYWVPAINYETSTEVVQAAVINPLVHQNTSNIYGLQFSSTFTGKESFLADHIINGKRLLPGVAYLEMARAAAVQAWDLTKDGNKAIRIENVNWLRPVIVGDQPLRVDIGLYPEDSGQIVYEVYSGDSGEDREQVIHSQGIVTYEETVNTVMIDLKDLEAQCNRDILTGEQCYQIFKDAGFHYGVSHRGIEKVYVGDEKVLVKLYLSPEVFNANDGFVLHPGLVDSALQGTLGLFIGSDNKPGLPIAVGSIEIFNRCSPSMWAFIRYSEGSKAGDNAPELDIDLLGESGEICIRIERLALKVPEEQRNLINSSSKELELNQTENEDEFYLSIFEKIAKGEMTEEQLEEQLRVS